MLTALRPLNTGELLDKTFSLYRNHFVLFAGIVALPHLISLAVQLVVGLERHVTGTGMSEALGTVFWALMVGLVGLLVGAASQAATVVAVSELYLDRPTSIRDAFSRVSGRIPVVVFLTIVIAMGVAVGFIFLIVPGVLLTLMWSLAIPVAVLEHKGIGDSMSRSGQLTKGDWGRIFVIWLLFVVLSIAVNGLLQWPITFAVMFLMRGNPNAMVEWLQVVSSVMTFISECLVGPLATIAFSLVYYDERVRKEAFDLQFMMATLDATAPTAIPST